MKAHEKATELRDTYSKRDLNEADTRHQIIDPLLRDVFGWPDIRVRCEKHIVDGYADYHLERADGGVILLIEAKREGAYFSLPAEIVGKSQAAYIKVKTLLTDPAIKAAITQVREYCLDIGCDTGVITNGHEWIVFRTFQKETDWRELKAYVVASLDYFADRFIDAYNQFSYTAVAQDGALRRLLLDDTTHSRELFYPKTKVTSYDAPVDSNQYASSLRSIAEEYFGTIDAADSEFMERCYVSDREYDVAFANARRRLEDAITPYLEKYNIQNFEDVDGGGGFGNRLSKNVVTTKATDVVVLFGGKGVGKSTFLRKLLFHKPPQILKKNAVVAYLDLLNTPPDLQLIRETIWKKLIAAVDRDRLLSGDREVLIRLFAERYTQALKQDLFGLDPKSEVFNTKLNELIGSWKSDYEYVAASLSMYWRLRHKALIVVIDNTDQWNSQLQDASFAVAQEVGSKLDCLVVISMREERFYASSIHGVLDAYQNSGFHITPPSSSHVFLRRIAYVQKLLNEAPDEILPSRLDRDVCKKLFGIFEGEFKSHSSHLASFLTACSQGNIRLALELFRGFLVSGYTNVFEMTSIPAWTLQIHQVMKPFMIPSRFFYGEHSSRIPNIFQLRSKVHSSHFTALRILHRLYVDQNSSNPAFIAVSKLAAEFIDVFGMREDFEANLDMLLKHRMIEANNRLEEFDNRVDSVRITAYGAFMLNAMPKAFTYVELVCVDCAIADQAVANGIAEMSNDDYRLYVNYERLARIHKRIEKADLFIKYLEGEEARETELFKIHDHHKITPAMRGAFDSDKLRVLRSAKRNVR